MKYGLIFALAGLGWASFCALLGSDFHDNLTMFMFGAMIVLFSRD